ncbi:12527_t:CDS:2, partial [Racocetra persica]
MKVIKIRKNLANLDAFLSQKKRKISNNLNSCPQHLTQSQNLIQIILSCTLPLSIVNNNEFRQFCSSLDSSFMIPNSETIRNTIINAYNQINRLIQNKIIETVDITNNNDNVKTALSQMQIEIILYLANILKISIELELPYAKDILNKSKKLIEILDNNTNHQKLRDIQQQIDRTIENLKQHLSIYQPKNDIIQQIIDNILDNLKKNFEVPSTLGLYRSFFDSHFKKLLYIDSELRCQILNNLCEQFTKLVEPATSNTLGSNSKMLAFFHIFIQENRQTEFDKYLELPQLPVTENNNSLR